MSPPRDVPRLQYLLSEACDRFDINVLKNSLYFVYRKLNLHIERWYIHNIIDEIGQSQNHDSPVITEDTLYTRHVCSILSRWISEGLIGVDNLIEPTYIREVTVYTLISSSFFEVADACYRRFGHRSVVEALSNKFAIVPHFLHLFSYVQQIITHMQDPLYVPEKNEGSDMILEILAEWNHNGEIDDTML
jgi:hypothetical protein